MKILVQGRKIIGLLTLLSVLGFGLGGTGTGGSPLPVEEKPLAPAILKVCLGCTYSSIQSAVDAAQPGDTIQVYPAPLTDLGWIEDVVISKSVTIEAIPWPHSPPPGPGTYSDVVLLPKSLDKSYYNPHFVIDAESGQVIIRGFTFRKSLIKWIGKADLLLENNRFEESSLTLWSGLGGSAEIRQNQIEGGLSVISLNYESGRVHLVDNRIDGTIGISPIYDGRVEGQKANIILETNIVNGSVGIGGGNIVLMNGNILIGRVITKGSIFYMFEGLVLQPVVAESFGRIYRWLPVVLEANRNIITNYLRGIVIEAGDAPKTLEDCYSPPPGLLQISGQDNLVVQNRYEDLCPADYPWPPGFRK